MPRRAHGLRGHSACCIGCDRFDFLVNAALEHLRPGNGIKKLKQTRISDWDDGQCVWSAMKLRFVFPIESEYGCGELSMSKLKQFVVIVPQSLRSHVETLSFKYLFLVNIKDY